MRACGGRQSVDKMLTNATWDRGHRVAAGGVTVEGLSIQLINVHFVFEDQDKRCGGGEPGGSEPSEVVGGGLAGVLGSRSRLN